MGAAADSSDADQQVEIWKVKKLIKSLEEARGNGTSMISLVIPPKVGSCPNPTQPNPGETRDGDLLSPTSR